MVITESEIGECGSVVVLQKIKRTLTCPGCNETIELDFGEETIQKFNGVQKDIIPYVCVHGNPQHAMLVYIDNNFNVRSKSLIESVEIKDIHDI